jgi:dynein heavy chain
MYFILSFISRPIVTDELEKKHVALIESVKLDFEEVERIFLLYKDNPPVASNLPPIAGALTWCHGLLERIEGINIEKHINMFVHTEMYVLILT